MDRKGEIGTGMYIFSMVLIALFVLAGISSGFSGLLAGYGNNIGGFLGFFVKHFLVVLLIGLTFTLFVAFSAFRGGA